MDNLYLRCLTNKLHDAGLAAKLTDDYTKHRKQTIYNRYMHHITAANTKAKKESEEYYQPKIDYLKSLLLQHNIPFNLEMEDNAE